MIIYQNNHKIILLYFYKSMKLKKLTQGQKDNLKKHSVHHSTKHMASMRMNMMMGKTFDEAHKIAKKKAGK